MLAVTDKKEGEAVGETTEKVGAEDHLAQQLPAVEDKLAAVAAEPGKTAGKPAGGPAGQGAGASAKPQPSGSKIPEIGTGTAIGNRPPARSAPAKLAPAKTTTETPVVEPGDAGASNGSVAGG